MRNLAAIALALFAAVLIAPPTHAQDLEHRVEAEYIERFTHYIDWPKDWDANRPDDPFTVCVLGADPFGKYLSELFSEVKVKGKKTATRNITSVSDINTCQIVFISSSEESRLREILQHVEGKPILTISEIPGFAQHGGMIRFVRSDKYIRFEINPDTASRAHLKISSRLLDLAVLVKREGES
jgi:hypothetical protein